MASTAASKAVVPQALSPEDFMSLLQQTGMVSSGGGDFHRMSIKGGMLVTDAGTAKEQLWPPTDRGRGPAFLARIVKPPVYYNAFWLTDSPKPGSKGEFDAREIGLADMNGKFVKKYDDPAEQAADQFAYPDVYERVNAASGLRGSFKGDIQLQIIPDSGQLTGEEDIYTLSLGTTSALDFRGTSANPQGGVVQEKNFIVQLGEFAIAQVLEANPKATREDLAKAVLDAMTALRLGNVVAAVYTRQASDSNTGNAWPVVSFEPRYIAPETELEALPSGGGTAITGDDEIPL